MGMIKVLVVDDVAILRNSIKIMLQVSSEIEVVGTASNGREAFEKCSELIPDIVLMDLRMPGVDGVEGTELIKEKYPQIKVMILTTFKEEEDIQAAIGSGADGYILKDIEPDELIAAIKNAYKGFYTVHKDVFDSITRKSKKSEPETQSVQSLFDNNGKPLLSVQDVEIIRHLVNGKSYKDISKIMFISEGHIRNQISKILRKLDLTDRMQLSLFAIKNKIL
ncbi:response regulator transcription factor [Acetivibrio cellulolyticus]|uniref:response regulator transcription factor n=1 Tax=Acetivibrio cellulolyticus TaxID=35830 RepID=UPI0001E304B9|nr:response regulator transcription factor [Acetivibrio cellulolyticus]